MRVLNGSASRNIFKILIFTFLVLVFSLVVYGKKWNFPDPGQDPATLQLKKNIEQVIEANGGLCAGLAIIRKGNPDLIFTMGQDKSDVNRALSENTMFRTGSVSKMFVALSILRLEEEGRLSLEDPIREIIPEVRFENPWEKTHPVRIVHLLEHTTGWDEIHLVERMNDRSPPVALKDALSFHPHSRKSRWAPGSRLAYCNAGYAVAARIVEKISGKTYEEFVEQEFFKPLGMHHSTFFNDRVYKQWAAETYNWAMEKVDYRNELYRPAAALNSSPADLAMLLRLLMDRGTLDFGKLLNEKSVVRMEISGSTPGAKAGLELGYGLGNFTSVYKGHVYHGHDGAMDGGMAQLAYLPGDGIGHVILLNANNGKAMGQITALVREFETEDLPTSEKPQPDFDGVSDIRSGYYLSINPRNQNLFYQDVLFAGIGKIEVQGNTIIRSWLFPGPETIYHPISPTQCTFGSTGKIGLVRAEDMTAGEVLYTENLVLKRISAFRVFGQLTLFGLWILLIFAGLLCFVKLFVLNVVNRGKYNAVLRISLSTTLPSLLIILIFMRSFFRFTNMDLLLSHFGYLSLMLLVFSVLFVAGAFASAYYILRSGGGKRYRFIYYSNALLSILHITASIYLVYFGFIPLITWA